ncbi:hypothetical protein M422DRAFT_56349 [Sphaerobolus stellatus SS14]|uniref:Heterokaryon incompatibility domain-containing protein n=1 Tax=Sphaerobolus stellatus (strain SS14) TaxID=990650 RepID=A0A0C9TRS9_SPHS4|nr:hypothetical protein M422DRAFT_56349 [Sphaerobolus stellatus SS14]
MDHLLLPTGTKPYITVPYKCTERYDGDDFLTYPERKGWDKDIANNDFGRRSSTELDAFFQTWLFFGCLTEVLKVGKVEVYVNDFIDRETNTITTKKLPQLFVRWKQQWPDPKGVSPRCSCKDYQIYEPGKRCGRKRCWQSVVRDCSSVALRTTRIILNEVFQFVDRICGMEGREAAAGESYSDSTLIPVQPEVSLSISALGSALLSASIDIYDCPPGDTIWGGVSIMKERFIRANWCPSRIAKTLSELDIAGRYYCAANPVKEEGDHTQCNIKRCVAQTVDTEQYPTKHVPGCSCTPAGLVMEDLIDIIGREGTPIVTWVRDINDTQPHAVVVDAVNSKLDSSLGRTLTPDVSRYVAISHVWSDGLGNPTGNTLPVCQLACIQEMVDELFTDRCPDEHIPFWMDTLCVPVHDAECRKKCIIRMRTIYQEAAAVLVLDAGVQQISLSAPLPDRCLALYQSGWWRRLWTYQEGILAKDLYIHFSDGVNNISELGMDLELEEHRSRGYYGNLGFIDLSIHFELFKLTAGELPDEARWVHYLNTADAVSSRRTTKASDETLCLSTVMGINPAPFLRLKGDADKLVEVRMELFLHYVPSFRRGIIFNSLPRLKRDGYRWAPRSLLGHSPGDMDMGEAYNRDHNWSQNAVMHKTRKGIEGLLLRFPGIQLMSVPSHLPSTIIVGDGIDRFQVRLLLDESADFHGWDNIAQYFLVLSGKPDSDKSVRSQRQNPTLVPVTTHLTKRHGVMSVLGTVADSSRFGPVTVRYACRAWVELLDNPQDYDVEGVISEDQIQWLIL